MILSIYGGSGLGREVLELAKQINELRKEWEQIVFIDDVITEETINGIKKYSYEEFKKFYSANDTRFTIALGEPALKNMLYEKVLRDGYEPETLIHPSVYIPDTAMIGKGVTICANSFVSCNTEIFDNVCLQPFCLIGHDSKIENSCVVSAFSVVCGHCVIGESTFIGVHSSIKENCTVGAKSIIGMGAMVFKDIPDGVIAMGNPARVLKNNTDERVFK